MNHGALRLRVGPRDWPAFGRRLWNAWPADRGLVLYLEGPLGAGKTSLVRGFLRATSPQLEVLSPTFILREDYVLEGGRLFTHIDLYRMKEAGEVEDLGLRELDESTSLLVEWPERGYGHVPRPDLVARLIPTHEARLLEIEARSAWGHALIGRLSRDRWCQSRLGMETVNDHGSGSGS